MHTRIEQLARHAVLPLTQALSLDVLLGVVGGGAFAVWWTAAEMPPAWWCVLPAATWVLYSTDRLLDARRVGLRALSFRHRLYARHAGLLGALTLGVAAATLWASHALLPRSIHGAGLMLGAAAGAYLFLAQRCRSRLFFKELAAGLLYVCGIWLGPLLLAGRPTPWAGLPVAVHLLAAVSNLLAFSVFERRLDAHDGHRSAVRQWGARRVLTLLGGLTGAGVALVAAGIALLPPTRQAGLGVLLLAAVTPRAMLALREWFEPRERYRLYGDGVFALLALPALFHWLAGLAR